MPNRESRRREDKRAGMKGKEREREDGGWRGTENGMERTIEEQMRRQCVAKWMAQLNALRPQ